MKSIFLILLILTPIQLYSWTTPIDISNTPGGSNDADITCDKYGRIHVVWNDNSSGNYEILYRCYEGDSWDSITNVSSDLTHSHYPQVSTDTSGLPHIVWVDWGTGYLRGEPRYAFYDGSSWHGPVNLTDTFPEYSYLGSIDIVIDTLNNIHIVWSSCKGYCEVYHSVNDGTSWSNPINVSNNPEEHSSGPRTAIDSKNSLHAVWRNYEGGGTVSDSIEIYYSKYDTSWSMPINISNMVGSSRYPKICCSPQNNPYVIWQEWEGGFYVYYTFCNGDSWATPWKISRGIDPVISVDLHNNIHVVFDWYVLYYTFYNGDSWSDTLKIWDSPVNALLPAMVTDGEWLHLVWTEAMGGDSSQIYYSKHEITGVEENPEIRHQKSDARLLQNYPNPFITKTEIPYILRESAPVTITISDLAGRVIKRMELGHKSPGHHIVPILIESLGKNMHAGIYFYRLETSKFIATEKMVVMH